MLFFRKKKKSIGFCVTIRPFVNEERGGKGAARKEDRNTRVIEESLSR